jgi:hypothetical protein
MMFVDIKPNQADGSAWTSLALEKLSSKWDTLLKSGSLNVKIYDISDKDEKNPSLPIEKPKLLINIDKSWTTKDVMMFALSQPEVIKVTKDSKDFYPKDYKDKDDL